MRRMFSQNQIVDLIKNVVKESSTEVLEAIKGHDINVEGITSKGIANTGAIGNIGDVAISGDLSVTGKINNVEDPSVKPIYWHTLKVQRGGSSEYPTVGRFFGYVIVLNNNPNPFTLNDFLEMLATPGVSLILHSGRFSSSGGSDLSGMVSATRLVYNNPTNFDVEYYDSVDNLYKIGGQLSIATGWAIFQDLGANKIN